MKKDIAIVLILLAFLGGYVVGVVTTDAPAPQGPPPSTSARSPNMPPGHPGVGAAGGSQARTEESYRREIQQIKDYLATQDDTLDIRLHLATLHNALGQSQEVTTNLDRALELAGTDPAQTTKIANFYFDTDQYEKAIETYQAVLQQQPDNHNVRTDLGVMYRRNGNPELAAEQFEKVVEEHPDHLTAWFNLGVVYTHDLDAPQKAKNAWEEFLNRAPANDQRLGMVQAQLQRNQQTQGGE